MRQIFQNLSDGETALAEVPAPQSTDGHLLIATARSLLSAGTERMLVDFGKAGWIDKARQQPDKVRVVIDKVRTDGLLPTIEAVQSKLGQPLPMGYCNVGRVAESGVDGFQPGERVASNGPHAELVRVPGNLCAHVPDGVDDDSAAFTALGAIALQGVRLAVPTIGESVAVIGLGLIGLITVQILRANGCRVIGIDFDAARGELARRFGAEFVNLGDYEDPVAAARAFSRGRGIDAVVITASTKSNDPVKQAANMCRKRGRIVLVGVTGLELSRADFFEKELSFQVSCSYGPGRYDPAYEEHGQDYPVGFVRWTEQRNFEAVLDLMASGTLDVRPLISHRFRFDDALAAYAMLDAKNALGILLEYHGSEAADFSAPVKLTPAPAATHLGTGAVCGFMGGGNYAGRILIPAFRSAGAQLHTIVTSGGASAAHQGGKHGFEIASTDVADVIGNEAINTAVIATRHDLHAEQVLAALDAGKHVFVEKPLALTLDELGVVEKAYAEIASSGAILMVGFNRRFAPHVLRLKELLQHSRQPKAIILTVNAGEIPANHWTQDRAVGGGRVIGEACHFIDLARHLAGARIINWNAMQFTQSPGGDTLDDKVTISLAFEDGSMATIHYLANGSKSFPKERIEVFCAGGVIQLDNFRKMRGYGWRGFARMNRVRQDKGNAACAAAFVDAIEAGALPPIPSEEIFEISRITIEIGDSLAH